MVPLTYERGDWDVFLVRHRNGGHWSFPKGHAEKGESPKEAAERELKEETGLEVIRYLDHPYVVEKYQFRREGALVDKTVRFYLAEVTTKYFLQLGEIEEGKWLPLREILQYATFKEEVKLFMDIIKVFDGKDRN
ncbi:MAG: NUDIX domain-containing protein [Chlamydiia bacterium]|nr:NUDIX domain-containing protein [Chlamydiia bacterium]